MTFGMESLGGLLGVHFENQMQDTHSRSSSSMIVFGARVVIAHPARTTCAVIKTLV